MERWANVTAGQVRYSLGKGKLQNYIVEMQLVDKRLQVRFGMLVRNMFDRGSRYHLVCVYYG